jgi:glycosyltransferase involved in cell wall biosynthesis
MILDRPKVSILLATLNGARFLESQLRSILQQKHRPWDLILSDDGSYDDTLSIAQKVIPEKQLKLLEGPRLGLTQNFWNALQHVPLGHYAAFCDQDDVWRQCKLTRALDHLSGQTGPAVYASGRIVTNDDLEIQWYQKRRKVGAFAQLLFRNQIAGHTCVLNPKAVKALQRYAPPANVPFHDWWSALILKGIGAQFIHDPTPTLYYRQHTNNALGARRGRTKALLDGRYNLWLQNNFDALWPLRENFTSGARHALRVCLPLRAGLSLTQR